MKYGPGYAFAFSLILTVADAVKAPLVTKANFCNNLEECSAVKL